MAKARRKMRRALMKKMRKGALTPGERRDLMELDREVNRANRQAAGIGGAGLAAALTLASKTGALKEGKDALGDFLDERAGVREERKGQKAIEKEEEREAKERAEDEADLSRRASAAARSEERDADRAEREEEVQLKREEEMEQRGEDRLDRRLERRGGFDPRTGEYVDSDKQKAEDEIFDKEFDEFLDELDYDDEALSERIDSLREGVPGQRNAMSDREIFKMLKKEGSLPGQRGDDYIGSSYEYEMGEVVPKQNPFAAATPMAMMREIRRDEREEKRDKRADDRIQKQIDFVNKYGGFNPSTGEYVDSAKQMAADEEFDREFDESLPDAEVMEIARLYSEGRREEAERLAAQVLTPEQQQMERFRNRSAVQALRGERSDLPMDASDYRGGFDTSGERPEFSSSSLRRSDGPRVDNADGGNTPFLRQMRDRIRKKFR